MEFGSVKKFAEDQRDLLLHNSGSVVLHADLEAIRRRCFNMDPDFRNNSGFLACIERIIDGFFYSGKERLAWVIESEQMPVLRKELADRDVTLLRRQRFSRNSLSGGSLIFTHRIQLCSS